MNGNVYLQEVDHGAEKFDFVPHEAGVVRVVAPTREGLFSFDKHVKEVFAGDRISSQVFNPHKYKILINQCL